VLILSTAKCLIFNNKLITYCVLMLTQPTTLGQSVIRGDDLMRLTRAVVCLHAALQVQLSVSEFRGWRHNALRYH